MPRGLEQDVRNDYISLEEAAERFGLHPKSIERLVREGVLDGYKANIRARRRWLVSVRSLRNYTDETQGFFFDRPGPKPYLRRLDDSDEDNGHPPSW